MQTVVKDLLCLTGQGHLVVVEPGMPPEGMVGDVRRQRDGALVHACMALLVMLRLLRLLLLWRRLRCGPPALSSRILGPHLLPQPLGLDKVGYSSTQTEVIGIICRIKSKKTLNNAG